MTGSSKESFSQGDYGVLSWQVTATQNMPRFLRYLTDRVHQAVPGGKVLWYDSVLKSGELSWQNELNDNNQ